MKCPYICYYVLSVFWTLIKWWTCLSEDLLHALHQTCCGCRSRPPPLRARPRWHPHLLHLWRGSVGAHNGGPGHAGEAGGDVGPVGRSAVPHGRSPNRRSQRWIWRFESRMQIQFLTWFITSWFYICKCCSRSYLSTWMIFHLYISLDLFFQVKYAFIWITAAQWICKLCERYSEIP